MLQSLRFGKIYATLALILMFALEAAAQSPRLRILVVHGPNMNLLGRREPQIYGTMTLDQINTELEKLAKELNVELIKLQTNHEGVIVDTFQSHIDDVDGAIINAAGLSFHSVRYMTSSRRCRFRSSKSTCPTWVLAMPSTKIRS